MLSFHGNISPNSLSQSISVSNGTGWTLKSNLPPPSPHWDFTGWYTGTVLFHETFTRFFVQIWTTLIFWLHKTLIKLRCLPDLQQMMCQFSIEVHYARHENLCKSLTFRDKYKQKVSVHCSGTLRFKKSTCGNSNPDQDILRRQTLHA